MREEKLPESRGKEQCVDSFEWIMQNGRASQGSHSSICYIHWPDGLEKSSEIPTDFQFNDRLAKNNFLQKLLRGFSLNCLPIMPRTLNRRLTSQSSFPHKEYIRCAPESAEFLSFQESKLFISKEKYTSVGN